MFNQRTTFLMETCDFLKRYVQIIIVIVKVIDKRQLTLSVSSSVMTHIHGHIIGHYGNH